MGQQGMQGRCRVCKGQTIANTYILLLSREIYNTLVIILMGIRQIILGAHTHPLIKSTMSYHAAAL